MWQDLLAKQGSYYEADGPNTNKDPLSAIDFRCVISLSAPPCFRENSMSKDSDGWGRLSSTPSATKLHENGLFGTAAVKVFERQRI